MSMNQASQMVLSARFLVYLFRLFLNSITFQRAESFVFPIIQKAYLAWHLLIVLLRFFVICTRVQTEQAFILWQISCAKVRA